MTAHSSPISLIFVPGAWHSPKYFDRLVTILEDGTSPYKCVPVTLPSVGAPDGSLSRTTWQPDIAAVSGAIQHAISSGSRVVVIAHSYGSIPANEALRGVDRGKASLLIISGFLYDVGTSILGANEGTVPPACDIVGDIVLAKDPIHHFYRDITEAEQVQSAEGLELMPLVFLKSETSYAAWKDFPTTYVLCEEDYALPPTAQEQMIADARGKGANIDVERIQSSHSPFLSQPQRIAEIVRRVAGREQYPLGLGGPTDSGI